MSALDIYTDINKLGSTTIDEYIVSILAIVLTFVFQIEIVISSHLDV